MDRNLPAPQPNPETQPYWDAACQGRLVLRKCNSCARVHHYPRAICPFCFGDADQWVTASGEGTIYSFSIMRRAQVPYAIAYVSLAEGVAMLTNIVDCDLNSIRIGQAVKLVFKPTDGGPDLPMFTPAPESAP
jgi:uncharacterized OB-fold protein